MNLKRVLAAVSVILAASPAVSLDGVVAVNTTDYLVASDQLEVQQPDYFRRRVPRQKIVIEEQSRGPASVPPAEDEFAESADRAAEGLAPFPTEPDMESQGAE